MPGDKPSSFVWDVGFPVLRWDKSQASRDERVCLQREDLTASPTSLCLPLLCVLRWTTTSSSF